jgi:hypothetical protein
MLVTTDAASRLRCQPLSELTSDEASRVGPAATARDTKMATARPVAVEATTISTASAAERMGVLVTRRPANDSRDETVDRERIPVVSPDLAAPIALP